MTKGAKDPYAEYVHFRQAWPQLFEDSGPGTIKILSGGNADAAHGQGVGLYYQDEYISVLRDRVRFPEGRLGLYVRIVPAPRRSRGIAVLPVRSNKLLLVRQFRHATRRFHDEIPRGFGEEGASAEENARRELLEETGFEAIELKSLGVLHPDTGLLGTEVELMQAFISDRVAPAPKEVGTELVELGVEELKAAIRRSEVTDSFTIAAFTRAYT